MAIVFISLKEKQKTFFRIIITILLLLLFVVFIIVFIIWFINKNQVIIPIEPLINQPDIAINLNIIDSDKVKNLEPFYNLETEFMYVVQDQNGNQVQGNISAATKEDAKMLLEASGLTVTSLEEANIGRSDPFVSY